VGPFYFLIPPFGGPLLRYRNQPKAILMVSAHWCMLAETAATMPRPPTILDFGCFPEELLEIAYPAPGDPAFAPRVRDLLAPHSCITARRVVAAVAEQQDGRACDTLLSMPQIGTGPRSAAGPV
jgi:hypothetical protein